MYKKNALGIESEVAWATPGYFTTHSHIPKCSKDDITINCQKNDSRKPIMKAFHYIDPSNNNNNFITSNA